MTYPATISDVARAAGVSISTVSRVVNGRTQGVRIGAATRATVLATARELDYQPNRIARDIALGKGAPPRATPPRVSLTASDPVQHAQPNSRQIGLIISSSSSAETLALIPSLVRVLASTEYQLDIVSLPPDPAAAGARVTRLLHGGVAGVLCCPSLHPTVSAAVAGTVPVMALWTGSGQAMLTRLNPPSAAAVPTPIPRPAPVPTPNPVIVVPVPVPAVIPAAGDAALPPSSPVPLAPPLVPAQPSEPVPSAPVPEPKPAAVPCSEPEPDAVPETAMPEPVIDIAPALEPLPEPVVVEPSPSVIEPGPLEPPSITEAEEPSPVSVEPEPLSEPPFTAPPSEPEQIVEPPAPPRLETLPEPEPEPAGVEPIAVAEPAAVEPAPDPVVTPAPDPAPAVPSS